MIDLPATLRAAAVGLGLWFLLASVVCRWMSELGRMVDDRD